MSDKKKKTHLILSDDDDDFHEWCCCYSLWTWVTVRHLFPSLPFSLLRNWSNLTNQACTAAAYCNCSLTGGPTTNCLPGLWSWCEKFAWRARCNTPKLSTLEFRWNWSLVALDYIILKETFKVRGVSSLIVSATLYLWVQKKRLREMDWWINWSVTNTQK